MVEDFSTAAVVARSAPPAALPPRHRPAKRANGLNREDIVAEVESLGRPGTSQAGSLPNQATAHRLTIERGPTHPAATHGWAAAVASLAQAQRRRVRGMARPIDGAERFADARRGVFARDRQRVPPEPLPKATPLSLAEPDDRKADRRAVLGGPTARAAPRG